MSSFLEGLSALSWQVCPAIAGGEVPAGFASRYGQLPIELTSFISSFSLCANPSDDAWFVSMMDLARDTPFRLNEYELMSLAAAGSDTDWHAAIHDFWRCHFPLFLSVNGSYHYFAYCLEGPAQGQIVHGAEPEFEECAAVESSLDEFLILFVTAAGSPMPVYPFSVAIPHNAS